MEPFLWNAKEITYQEMLDALKTAVPSSVVIRQPLHDNRYWLPTYDEFIKLLEWDTVDWRIYLAERFDCDDSADTVKSHFREFFGLNNIFNVEDYSGVNQLGEPNPHMYSLGFFFYPDGIIGYRYFEPQSDEFITIGYGIYTLKFGYVTE
jgi:hypothetical protein